MAKNPAAPGAESNGTAPAAQVPKPRLHERYLRDAAPALVRDFNYQNPMQVPRLAKVTVNVGVGEAITNAKALDATVRDVSMVTGQKPVITRAKKSIASFKSCGFMPTSAGCLRAQTAPG